MFHEFSSTVRALLRDAAGSLYHIVVVALSAGIALLLPSGAKHFLALWSRVEHDKLSLIIVEMIVAVLLIGCFSYIRRCVRDRDLATAAAGAGLVSFFPRRARRAQRHIQRLKEEQGTGRTIMVIGSSGYSSISSAYGFIANAGMLQLRDLTFTESIDFNRPIAFTVKGGYDTNFVAAAGTTTISGALTFTDGSVTVENITLQ